MWTKQCSGEEKGPSFPCILRIFFRSFFNRLALMSLWPALGPLHTCSQQKWDHHVYVRHQDLPQRLRIELLFSGSHQQRIDTPPAF